MGTLTREQALAMQDALLCEYKKPEFQEKLRAVLQIEVGKANTALSMKEFERELREVREQVGTKFGFEASPEGVAKSTAAFTEKLRADPEIIAKCREMEHVLYPHMQDYLAMKGNLESYSNMAGSMAMKKEMIKNMKHEHAKATPTVAEPSRRWIVVGGGSKGGIVVRKGERIQSHELMEKLATGAMVQEIELINDRLHYKKIKGDGPNFGWVSIIYKGVKLLEPTTQMLPEEEQTFNGP